MKRKLFAILTLALAAGTMLVGCASTSQNGTSDSSVQSSNISDLPPEDTSADNNVPVDENTSSRTTELTARFGYEGEAFTLHLYDNDTAAAIAKHVGTSDWNLPIYHYDDFENSEVMQYYDIPSRYEIPSAAEEITEEKAGEVYYSEPNRIILFYHDAEVSAEYTPVGYFDANDEFIEAVENNPVLEGWGNKIITISANE
ncbi:MAG: cyclophilin-like fold protein [Clostridiales bacterium]|nr:cyclophilin-like fold protein [Clostridiales bacterium]